jgi:hypothetical protein
MLSVHPSYGRAEWRPGFNSGPSEWDAMVETVTEERLKLAADKRVTEVMN